ncbi:hypothetical protein [Kordia sp.]|uniref:hypothetical protein n=1 Tax=Kordia sp. TaxID=1965332 RepID=UPI003B5B9DD1
MKYLQLTFLVFFINICYGVEHVIPFKLVHNNIILNTQLNGKSCKLMYDTGARSFILNSRFAQNNSITTADAFRGKVKGNFGSLELPVKYLIIEDLNVIAGDIYDGIIGIDFFKDFIVKIDYEHKVLILSDALEITDDYIKIETNHLLRNPEFLYWFTANVNVQLSNGDTFNGDFLIDTGSGRSISLTNDISKKLLKDKSLQRIKSKGTKSSFIGFKDPTYVKIPGLKISSIQIHDYIVDCNTDVNKQTTKVIDGILGSKFLKNFTIIIDFKASSIYLKQNKLSQKPISNTFYSDGFQLKDHRKSGKGILISSIIQSSHFDLPIKLEDEIIEINDTSVSDMNFNDIEKIKQTLHKEIRYKVKRKRKEFFITTKVRDLFE